MASQFKKGDTVTLKNPPPVGVVESFRMDDEGVVSCLISWTDAQGQSQSRWFSEDELKRVE